MARRVPGAGPGSAPAPPPKLALRGPGTFAFTRGEAEGTGPGRGGAPSGLRANPRRTWAGRLCLRAPGGVAWVTEGARRASARRRRHRAPTLRGAPREVRLAGVRSPQTRGCDAVAPYLRGRAGSAHWAPLWAPVPLPGGSGLTSERTEFSESAQASTFHLSPPCSRFSLWPVPALLRSESLHRRARVLPSFPCFTSVRSSEPSSQLLPFGLPRRDWRGASRVLTLPSLRSVLWQISKVGVIPALRPPQRCES